MIAIRKSLLQFIFSGSSMRRWNDKLRPVELFEVDKQAHKMIAAYLLYQLQCRKLPWANDPEKRLALGMEIIEGGLFDYFYRLVITDIKPPVFYRIKENPAHHAELTAWVLAELEPVVRPVDEAFWQRLVAYHTRPHGSPQSLAQRILAAAHLYASKWEFSLIRPFNVFDEELNDISLSFNAELGKMRDIDGVPELLAGSGNALVRTANLCGQLRFQIRWSQTPRIPETSVLGHMFIVAAYGYFFSLSMDACPARCVNNFFTGLFHDIPELLTRDIISPVKRSVDQLPAIIHQYEHEELERRVLTPLTKAGYSDIVERLSYYLGLGSDSEFLQCARLADGSLVHCESFEELHNAYNENAFDGKDGQLVKLSDILAAFIEAHSSLYNGISSPALYEALARIRTEYRHVSVGKLNMGTLLADFD